MTNSFNNVNDSLIKSNTVNYYNPTTTKKSINPETSKNPKYVVAFINSLNYTEETKSILIKWYYAVGIKKVNIKMLKDSIIKLYQTIKTEKEAYESFNNSYLSHWLTFYPPITYNKIKQKNDPMYQEQIQATEDDFLKDENGNRLEY